MSIRFYTVSSLKRIDNREYYFAATGLTLCPIVRHKPACGTASKPSFLNTALLNSVPNTKQMSTNANSRSTAIKAHGGWDTFSGAAEVVEVATIVCGLKSRHAYSVSTCSVSVEYLLLCEFEVRTVHWTLHYFSKFPLTVNLICCLFL